MIKTRTRNKRTRRHFGRIANFRQNRKQKGNKENECKVMANPSEDWKLDYLASTCGKISHCAHTVTSWHLGDFLLNPWSKGLRGWGGGGHWHQMLLISMQNPPKWAKISYFWHLVFFFSKSQSLESSSRKSPEDPFHRVVSASAWSLLETQAINEDRAIVEWWLSDIFTSVGCRLWSYVETFPNFFALFE